MPGRIRSILEERRGAPIARPACTLQELRDELRTRRARAQKPEPARAEPPVHSPAPTVNTLPELDPCGRLNLLCPEGAVDFLLIWSKMATLAQERPVRFHLPEGAADAIDLAAWLGADVHVFPGLRGAWVQEAPGEPPIPGGPGWCSVQATTHLETGHHLSSWYAGIPLSISLPGVPGAQRHGTVVHIADETYREGNLSVRAWASLLGALDQTAGPVRLISGREDAPFARRVIDASTRLRDREHVLGAGFPVAAAALAGAERFVGAFGVFAVLASWLGTVSAVGYAPGQMPIAGGWERAASVPVVLCEMTIEKIREAGLWGL